MSIHSVLNEYPGEAFLYQQHRLVVILQNGWQKWCQTGLDLTALFFNPLPNAFSVVCVMCVSLNIKPLWFHYGWTPQMHPLLCHKEFSLK